MPDNFTLEEKLADLKALLTEILEHVRPKRAEPRATSVPAHTDEQWLDSLQTDPAFSHVPNVKQEYAKAQIWAKTNKRQCTRKFFVNWLNRIDRQMAAPVKPDLPPVMTKVTPTLPKGEPPPPEVAKKLGELLGKDWSM